MTRVLLVIVILIGFALRVHALAAVTLRWDEGWSIAISMLPVAEMLALTARDVHPPLYYLLLGPWLAALDVTEFTARYASVWASVLAIPLAAVAAMAWARGPHRESGGAVGHREATERPSGAMRGGAAREHVGAVRGGAARANVGADVRFCGLAAAVLVATAPAFVYYAGVTRMYALTAPALLLAVWGLGRRSWPATVGGSLVALHTFYYAGFALAGLFAGSLLLKGRRRFTVLSGAVTGLLYLPWLTFALPLMSTRLGGEPGNPVNWSPVPALVGEGLMAALFAYQVPVAVLGVPVILCVAGLIAARSWLAPRLLLAGLAVLLVLLGAAAGADAHMFAARYVIPATPFLALALAWSATALASRQRVLAAAAVGAAVLVNVPTLAGYVYLRDAEVTEAFDPAADWTALKPAAATDVVAFNILSLAGLYERYRGPQDPAWTYAQLWDPVHEPLDDAKSRIRAAASNRGRLWLVLYKGTYSEDSGELKAWADAEWFPAASWWAGDRLIQGYAAVAPDTTVTPRATFDGGVRLERATYSASVVPGGAIAAEFVWTAVRQPAADARIFAHVYDTAGTLVAQADGFPAADTLPPSTWPRGRPVADRRGFFVPEGVEGPLTLAVGLYDPVSGARWTLRGGEDRVVVGTIEVGSE